MFAKIFKDKVPWCCNFQMVRIHVCTHTHTHTYTCVYTYTHTHRGTYKERERKYRRVFCQLSFFLLKRTRTPWKYGWFWSGEKCARWCSIFYCGRYQGNCQRLLGLCKKTQEITWKASSGQTWVSIKVITSIDLNVNYISIYEFLVCIKKEMIVSRGWSNLKVDKQRIE